MTTAMATVDELRQQVQQAEAALRRIQEARADRSARINKLEEERCDLLIAARLDGKSKGTAKIDAIIAELAELRKANSEDTTIEPRISASLRLKKKDLQEAERACNCTDFLQMLDRYETETATRFIELAKALNDELEKCRARDLEMERRAYELGIKPLLIGTKFGKPISDRRAEIVAAELAGVVPTPFSRSWLESIRAYGSLSNLIRPVREKVAAEQSRAAAAVSTGQ